ncbi:TNT domain-containing protein [Amycolatopsis aidingensis]|uniref:TNT domain-containing protein n=1 Tax=Amycolatopsis aidingensis TaxID=2842453 RepID=UPI001C0B8474|nr:TNT domain-containing protein [Amycolatopsis aidingensis]
MGIELPAELAGIAAATGVSWPEADEDALRAQAAAWRTAQRQLDELAAAADAAAGAALEQLSGPAGEAAREYWSGFVHPDQGRLTVTALGAGQAADRLEHAADQVGAAKVEIVRQLTAAAKDRDAAQSAAAAGHPQALLGVDTTLRATAANLTALTTGLAATLAPESAAGGVVDDSPGVQRVEDGGTGPVRIGPEVTAARPGSGGLAEARGVPEAPTPPSGIALTRTPSFGIAAQTPPSGTTAAGYAAGPPPAAPAVPQQPPAAPPPGPAPAAPPAGYAPPPGGAYPAHHAHFAPARPQAGHYPPPPFRAQPPAAPPPAGQPPQHGQQPQHGLRPQAPLSLGAARQERESVVALFAVHMFPIGHLPIASDRPARQLPAPPAEVDYAAGLRFPPHDHPRSDLIDPAELLEALRAGRRLPAPPPAEVLPDPPERLTEGYDPLGGLSEREFNRRYLVHADERAPEYAWPPGELYPEGGREPGEPVLLAEGTLLDRFGGATGRVFAADGTPFAARSLPPSRLRAGYRRYRVRRELPMWLAESAPWFGQDGGGPRYRAVYSAAELVVLGYLADVTFETGTEERA